MSQHHQEETTGVIKNYTLTALLSFTIMFCLFLLLSRCHGNFHPATNHHAIETTEQHHSIKH